MASTARPDEKRLLTLGDLRKELRKSVDREVSLHQIKYAIDQYQIEPVTRVGIIRVWSKDAIPRIKSALARIARNRTSRW